MKKTFSIIFLFICSCASQKEVTIEELASILVKDTNKNKNVSWIYDGTDQHYHYFHRVIVAFLTFDPANGTYILKKETLDLKEREFNKTTDGSGHSKSGIIFTDRSSDRHLYDIQFIEQK